MGEFIPQIRSVIAIFAIAALILVFGVFIARGAGLLSETVTVSGTTAAFTEAGGEDFRRADVNATGASDGSDGSDGADGTAEDDGAEGAVSRDLRIITLLPKDGIPAIFDPSFVTADQANTWLNPLDQVIGVSVNGEHRAYGTAFLSNREVVNDTVGGRPIMVTW